MERITAVILAGGTGSRMNRGMPKQFIHVKGKPLILHSVEMFDKNKRITDIILVSHEDHIGTLLNIVKQAGVCKVRRVVPGGKTRQGSSFNGLKACPEGTEIVLIHDAARPFVDDAMIERTIAGAKKYKAVTTAIEVTDTLIEEKKGFVRRVPPREKFMRVQTPQGFKYELILTAHKNALRKKKKGTTDDAGLIIASGGKVKLVEGSHRNIKVTNSMDLAVAGQLANER